MSDDLPAYVTRVALQDDLRGIGISPGQTVMVHAAMSQVGPMLNGPDALVGALRDVLGPEGTVIVYTSWDSVHDDLLDEDGRVLPEWRDHVPVFNAFSSRAVRMNGVIAGSFAQRVARCAAVIQAPQVAAIGRLANWLTADHPHDDVLKAP